MNYYEEQDYNKRLDFNVWKKLFNYASPYKKFFLIIIIQMILLAGVDATFPLFSRAAIDNFIIPHRFKGFAFFSAIMIATVTFQAINVKIMILIAGSMEVGIPYDIRKAGFNKLQELPFSYYDRTPVGWVMARMTSDIRKIGNTLSWNLVDMTWSIAMMVIMMFVMLIINWRLTILVLAVVPILVIISLMFQKWILHNYRKVRKVNSHIVNTFNEGIMGAKTIKTLVREKEMLGGFAEYTKDMRSYAVKSATISSVYTPVVILLGSVGTAAIIWKGGNGVIYGTMSYGTLVAFISYAAQFFEPVKQFARIFNEIQYAQASAERILSLIEIEPDIKDSDIVISKYGNPANLDYDNLPDLKGNIVFDNVSFSYSDGKDVLRNFNLKIKAGETIALVGETGSGKSTIVNLACRFYEPVKGKILIDGTDYRDMPLLWLHKKLGYVLQEPHLFSGTIKENISYSRNEASFDEIVNAAKLVNAHSFITKLDKGYDFDVGEGGSKLSVGQKQLISFARAVLADPGIFILDEATSSVDTETENLIKDAIQNILNGRTSIIVAHRLSTIRSADRILVLEKGEIIEEGTHKQLLDQKGHYYNLYTNQFITDSKG